MALREGKSGITINLKNSTIKILQEIAKEEVTSRSAIAAKIIEENIHKYITSNK